MTGGQCIFHPLTRSSACRCGAVRETLLALLEVEELKTEFRFARVGGRGGAGRQLSGRAGRNGRRGGRIRVREERHGALGDGVGAESAGVYHARFRAAGRQEPDRRLAPGDAGDSRRQDGDGLSGPVLLPQPNHDAGRAGGRADPAAPVRVARGGTGAGDRAAARGKDTLAGIATGSTRTRFPAASASA